MVDEKVSKIPAGPWSLAITKTARSNGEQEIDPPDTRLANSALTLWTSFSKKVVPFQGANGPDHILDDGNLLV